ncbi:MAG TPA: hypothetical protein DDX71_05650 [Ruminococcus sp.]|nr:hypothetical protein [Ruminococcus sp.]
MCWSTSKRSDLTENYAYTVSARRRKPLNLKRGILAAAAAVLILFLLLIMKAMVPTDWRIFTKSRIETLEHTFNMDLSDADPERYWIPAIAQDIHERFRFTVNDYQVFMDDCFSGEILKALEDADPSFAAYKCRPYPDSRYTLYIEFTGQYGRYLAELTSYTE